MTRAAWCVLVVLITAGTSPRGFQSGRDFPDTGAPIDVAAFRHRRTIPAGETGPAILTLDPAAVAQSQGPARRFGDVRIADPSGRQVPYLLEPGREPMSLPLTLSPASTRAKVFATESGRQRSVYSLTLPHAGLPAAELVLESDTRVFSRHVQIAVEHPPDRAHRDAWIEVLASAAWQHASPAGNPPPAILPVPRRGGGELLLIVDEGDNQPLKISRARLTLPSWQLRFSRPTAEPLVLLYGHDGLLPPRYDLALIASALREAEARTVEALPESPQTGELRLVVVKPAVFWAVLAAAVLVLLAIAAKLLATASGGPSPPPPPAP